MFISFAILTMSPLAKQKVGMHLDDWTGAILLNVVFYMSMNVLLYTGYFINVPIALEKAVGVNGASDHLPDHEGDVRNSRSRCH